MLCSAAKLPLLSTSFDVVELICEKINLIFTHSSLRLTPQRVEERLYLNTTTPSQGS